MSWNKITKTSMPELGVEVIFFHPEWVNEDFNPKGTRVGFRQDDEYITAHWWDNQDTYITISESECTDNYSEYSQQIRDTTYPTHWMDIPDPPKK